MTQWAASFALAARIRKFLIAEPFTGAPAVQLSSPFMFPPVDTKNAAAVAALVEARFATLYPRENPHWIANLFIQVENLFAGRHRDYLAIDLRYHDLEHTLQATLCLTLLLEGRQAARAEPWLGPREFELAIAAGLLHDSGYLKLRSDTHGTGAKYAFCHVLRSGAFAAGYLPTLGAAEHEIEAVLAAINCTGPSAEISRLRFRRPIDRVIGCALGTADYLGQMGAADYPDELEDLYREFEESDAFVHTPLERRTFKSADDLRRRTPGFWRHVVLPKLENDFQSVLRFLAQPFPHGPNRYLDAVEANIARIEQRIADADARSTPRVAPSR